jgi:peptide/nickel transport system ATP-binding protein
MRLIEPPGKIEGGEIIYNNRDILKMNDDEIRHLRGSKIGMIFQDPMTFLNPVLKVGSQVSEMLLLHHDFPEAKISGSNKYDKKILNKVLKEATIEIFKRVRLADAENIYNRYPHELSGGMRQRILISMAIASSPDLIIADEATTSLDVTIQAQILDLLRQLKDELQKTLIFVTHNLGIVAEMCDRVCVLYGGQAVEVTPTKELFNNPIHPYTQGLIKAIPLLHKQVDELSSIDGVVPNLIYPPKGCRFHPRCELAEEICKQEKPSLVTLENGHMFACHVKERDYEDKIVARI